MTTVTIGIFQMIFVVNDWVKRVVWPALKIFLSSLDEENTVGLSVNLAVENAIANGAEDVTRGLAWKQTFVNMIMGLAFKVLQTATVVVFDDYAVGKNG